MRQNRQNERERGGTGGGRLEGGGIRVCDCQLWERDPLGGVKVQEKKKKEQKRQQRDGEKKRRRNGEECCFDVKGDGRSGG